MVILKIPSGQSGYVGCLQRAFDLTPNAGTTIFFTTLALDQLFTRF